MGGEKKLLFPGNLLYLQNALHLRSFDLVPVASVAILNRHSLGDLSGRWKSEVKGQSCVP